MTLVGSALSIGMIKCGASKGSGRLRGTFGIGRSVKEMPDEEGDDGEGTTVGVGRSKVITGMVTNVGLDVGNVVLNCAVLC